MGCGGIDFLTTFVLMEPFVIIPIRPETVYNIQHGDIGEAANMLQDDIEAAEQMLISLLKNYEQEKDPRGQVVTMGNIQSLEIDKDGVGQFLIYFPVNVYSGCKNIDEDFDEEMSVSINVDTTNNTATLTGEMLNPQRDPDEY